MAGIGVEGSSQQKHCIRLPSYANINLVDTHGFIIVFIILNLQINKLHIYNLKCMYVCMYVRVYTHVYMSTLQGGFLLQHVSGIKMKKTS